MQAAHEIFTKLARLKGGKRAEVRQESRKGTLERYFVGMAE